MSMPRLLNFSRSPIPTLCHDPEEHLGNPVGASQRYPFLYRRYFRFPVQLSIDRRFRLGRKDPDLGGTV